MAVVQEVLSSVRVVKAFGRETHEAERFMRHAQQSRRARNSSSPEQLRFEIPT